VARRLYCNPLNVFISGARKLNAGDPHGEPYWPETLWCVSDPSLIQLLSGASIESCQNYLNQLHHAAISWMRMWQCSTWSPVKSAKRLRILNQPGISSLQKGAFEAYGTPVGDGGQWI
jgi:hypothetical protein